jgi:hypothetical protein
MTVRERGQRMKERKNEKWGEIWRDFSVRIGGKKVMG